MFPIFVVSVLLLFFLLLHYWSHLLRCVGRNTPTRLLDVGFSPYLPFWLISANKTTITEATSYRPPSALRRSLYSRIKGLKSVDNSSVETRFIRSDFEALSRIVDWIVLKQFRFFIIMKICLLPWHIEGNKLQHKSKETTTSVSA